VGGAKVVFIIPLPRYVLAGCCKNTDHVSNRLSGELAAEFAGAERCLLEAAAMGERTGKARIVNLLSFFGSCESPPQDLTTVDGASICAGNGDHLTSNAIRVAARKLMTDLVNGGEDDEPENKRARLESVVPVPAPAPAKKKNAAKGQPPTSPPRPVPPLWLSGQLPPSQRGRGSGRGSGPARGSGHQGGPPRGGASGGNRSANNRQWRPPRGGQYGRWGRW
jgi:hypothetical protein